MTLRERRVELRVVLGRSLREGGDAGAAGDVLRPALVEQLALRATAASSHLWVQRRRELIQELARTEAALRDANAVLVLLQEYLDLAVNEDWFGRNLVARLCVEFAVGPFAGSPAAATLFARGREVVGLALAAGRAFEAREKSTSPAMFASMRAGTYAILVDLEAKAGDQPARAAALGSVAACQAEAFAAAKDERAEARLRQSCETWVEALRGCADDAGVAAACERMGRWFADRPAGIAFAARCAAVHLAARGEAAVVRSACQRALAAAIDAGFDRQAAADDPQLRPLLGQ